MNVQLKSYRKLFRTEFWSKQWDLKIIFRLWNFCSKNPLNMSQQGKKWNGTGIQNCYTSNQVMSMTWYHMTKLQTWGILMVSLNHKFWPGIGKELNPRKTFQVFRENGITVLVYLNSFYSLLLVKLLQNCKWYFKMDPLSFQSALCLATTGNRIIKIHIFQIFDTGDQFWARVGLES